MPHVLSSFQEKTLRELHNGYKKPDGRPECVSKYMNNIAPGEIRTPDHLVRSQGGRKSIICKINILRRISISKTYQNLSNTI